MILELKEKGTLRHSPGRIHTFLANPENWPKINPKIQTIAVEGTTCIGVILFKGKSIEFTGQLPERQTRSTVVCKLAFTLPNGDDETMDLTYDIIPKGNKTRVVETTRFGMRLPFWAWLLIKCISIGGRPQGPGCIENLDRELSENP